MKHHDSLGKLLRDMVFGDPVKKQWEKVEAALKAYADAVGRNATNATNAAFYTQHVCNLNPNSDWWPFAESKDKQVEFVRAAYADRALLHKLQRAVEEEYALYFKIKNGDSNAAAIAAALTASTSLNCQRFGRIRRPATASVAGSGTRSKGASGYRLQVAP